MFNRNFRGDNRGDSFRNNSFRQNSNISHGHNAPSLMSVSPWEGGVVPGSSSVSSLLGMPQMMQNAQNLLTPQAQTLAQNLNILSNLGLLQSQVQSRQPQALLPSLINLGSSLNRSMGPQQETTSYRHLQQANRGMGGSGNRFQDQPRYNRQDGRRPEPYNKNRPRPSQSQTSQQKLQSYRPLNSKVAQNVARKPSAQDADALARARAAVRGRNAPRNESPVVDLSADDEEDVKKEEGDEVVKKRDWKKEKKSDVKEIDDDKEKETEGDAKMEDEAEVVTEVKSNGDTETLKVEKDGPEDKSEGGSKVKVEDKSKSDICVTRYSCHVCTKDLEDEKALSSHLRTSAHKRMMNLLEDSYAQKVKKIREQMKANELSKERDLARSRRGGISDMSRGHCKMCELFFIGNITAHRKTPLHLKLKMFLHPNCVPCGKEFPARMEWDLHKLTVGHFKVISAADDKTRALMGSTLSKSALNEPNFVRIMPKFPEGLDSVVANMDEEKADKKPPSAGEEEKEGLIYEPNAIVGMNMLCHGQHCGVCNKFFSRRPDATEHCRTRTHFDNYVAMKAKLREVAAEKEKLAADEKAAAEAETKAAVAVKEEILETASEVPAKESEESESAEAEVKEVITDDKVPVLCLKRTSVDQTKDEGNWKRSRPMKNEEEDDDDDERDVVQNVEPRDDDEALKLLDDIEKYDPLEPTSPEAFDPSAIDTSLETQSGEAEMTVTGSPVAKTPNKARRGRKRK